MTCENCAALSAEVARLTKESQWAQEVYAIACEGRTKAEQRAAEWKALYEQQVDATAGENAASQREHARAAALESIVALVVENNSRAVLEAIWGGDRLRAALTRAAPRPEGAPWRYDTTDKA